jgi:hypothetical protein
MFEPHGQPLLSRSAFLRRVLRHAGVALGIVFGSLAIGILGYHFLGGFAWVDALLNAAMLLGGMGPIGELHTTTGKIFAALYALYAGLVFLVVAGVLFAPVFHRFLHRFHLELSEEDESETSKTK